MRVFIIVFIAVVIVACKNSGDKNAQDKSIQEKPEIVCNTNVNEISKRESNDIVIEKPLDSLKKDVNKTDESKVKVQSGPPKIVKTPYDVIVEMSKKYKFVGVWDMGWPGHYKVIVNRNGKYYLDVINTDTEELIKSHDVLKRISSKKYQGYAAVDMPENLVIDDGGNLNSYVYNPDMNEWVFMGMNIRVY